MGKMQGDGNDGNGPTRVLLTVPIKKFIDDYVYRIDLDADYQREKIWSRADQENLLDSVVQDIDIPKIYLTKIKERENFEFECVDGKQRMTTLLDFFKPEPDETPLTVRIAGEKYSYKRLKKELPAIAKKIEKYGLTFVIYKNLEDEEFLREIFRRLQLGVRLNSGELLKTYSGTIRDFVYKEIGRNGPFVRHTSLSEKRFSRQFTVAQICINSFSRNESHEFVRARYDDLAEFFKEKRDLGRNDPNLARIRKVLGLMDRHFGDRAGKISSRAVAVSAYLFSEQLYLEGRTKLIGAFAGFFVALLKDISTNLELLSKYQEPNNPRILEEFQKYVSQASVEPYAIARRHEFLQKAFQHFRSTGRMFSGTGRGRGR